MSGRLRAAAMAERREQSLHAVADGMPVRPSLTEPLLGSMNRARSESGSFSSSCDDSSEDDSSTSSEEKGGKKEEDGGGARDTDAAVRATKVEEEDPLAKFLRDEDAQWEDPRKIAAAQKRERETLAAWQSNLDERGIGEDASREAGGCCQRIGDCFLLGVGVVGSVVCFPCVALGLWLAVEEEKDKEKEGEGSQADQVTEDESQATKPETTSL